MARTAKKHVTLRVPIWVYETFEAESRLVEGESAGTLMQAALANAAGLALNGHLERVARSTSAAD